MNIRTFRRLHNDVYHIEIYTEDWSEGDRLLMARFGQPSINLGGDFSYTMPYVDFTLPDRYAQIMTDSPFSQCFDTRDHADAEMRATAWKTAIITEIESAIATMRAQDDDFTGEEVVTV